MKSRFLLFLALCAATTGAATTGAATTGAARAADTYRTYRNARFGTVVTYPANLVTPQPESAGGVGRKFVSSDGQIEITTYAFRNGSNRSASGEMARAIRDWKRDTGRLTYARSGASWFVLSGFLGNDIFYEKTLLRNGTFHTLIWQYPKRLKKRLDASLTRSAGSFSVGRTSLRAVPTPVLRADPTAPPQPTPEPKPIAAPIAAPTSAPRPPLPRTTTGGY